MSEVTQSDEVTAPVSVTATAGTLLREAREALGIHIASLAVALKVPASKLEALESDNYEALRDTVFVRALASSVCRTLKIDPTPVLSLLPQSKTPNLFPANAALNSPVNRRIGKSSLVGAKSRSVTFVVLALLVGAGAVFFLPHQQGVDVTVLPTHVSVPIDSPEPAKPEAVVGIPAIDGSPAVQPTAMELLPVPVASSLSAAPLAAGVAAASAPASAASSAVASAGPLVLRARSESWVQVRDAAGALALQRKLVAGESVSVAATLPLAVVIGRADATEVFVRGKPFDLTAVSRENVARFEVK